MWKCPICQNEEKSKYVCRKCGYDMRGDFVQWRTLCQVSDTEAEVQQKMVSDVVLDTEEMSFKEEMKMKAVIIGAFFAFLFAVGFIMVSL